MKIKILNQWKNSDRVICLVAFGFFSVLDTWQRACTNEVITGVTGHEKVKACVITLN